MKTQEYLDQFGEFVGYLYDRWQDEKEYEDWADYVQAMKNKLDDHLEFKGASKRPFSMQFLDTKENIEYAIQATASQVKIGYRAGK